jgi:hypothetical protein
LFRWVIAQAIANFIFYKFVSDQELVDISKRHQH